MSIAAGSVSELAVSAQTASTSTTTQKPPRKRQVVAVADIIAPPEAR
jgi:hypothetical protein